MRHSFTRARTERSGSVSVVLHLSFLMGWAALGTAATITDLGTLGGSDTEPAAINNSGQIVGASSTSACTCIFHAFLYSNGKMQDLGTLEPALPAFINAQSGAGAINNSGEVVGQSFTISGAEHAFLYANGTMQDLGALRTPSNSSTAWSINTGGQIVGDSEIQPGIRNAFLYSGGSMQDLGTLPGESQSSARSINASGQIVGISFTENGRTRAFLYSGGTMVDLGTLGGPDADATAINDQGLVVGDSIALDGRQHAFLYSGGMMHELDTPGEPSSYANSINNRGQIVGAINGVGPFLYSGGVFTDLNSLLPPGSGWELESAAAINDADQIVGTGRVDGEVGHAFLLDINAAPVPEPGVMELCGAAFAVFALSLLMKKAERTRP